MEIQVYIGKTKLTQVENYQIYVYVTIRLKHKIHFLLQQMYNLVVSQKQLANIFKTNRYLIFFEMYLLLLILIF